MYCSKCGSKVEENTSFCHNCGNSLYAKTASNPNPQSTKDEFKDLSKNINIKFPFQFIITYGIEWLGIIISLFSPICAYYHEYRGKIDISNYCTVFGGSWAYINSNYDPISTPEKGHHYAQFFAIIFLAIAILCLLIAILKKRYVSGHLITVFAYVLYSYLTLSTARKYFTHLDGENIKFTGMYIFATVLIGISLLLIMFFSARMKSRNKTN
ncbi:MAG: zinc-ribbon domain-containing protein [Ruminococcus sp.]